MSKIIYHKSKDISTLYFNDGSKLVIDHLNDIFFFRTYHYGEILQNKLEEYNFEDYKIFEYLAKNILQCTIKKTLFKKREYIMYNYYRIYKDELIKIEICKQYEDDTNSLPSIERLQKDLGFKDYSELVFNREQELKSMLIRK